MLQMTAISKRFPGVTALDSVSLGAGRGEIVALVGENGAGKSTLMKILAGIHEPDSGSITIDERPAVIRSPRDAARHGIAVVHQELELIENLDVAANVFLGREPVWGGPAKLIDRKKIYADTARILARLRMQISPRVQVEKLSLGHKQMIEIVRAISLDARLLIMDEPTSSLTTTEAESLFDVIRELRSAGVGIIYITHRLAEVEALADRVVVLRDGRNAGELRRADIRHDRIVQMMVGRDLKELYAEHASAAGEVCLELKHFRTRRYPDREVSLTAFRGQVLGLAGLIGSGRSELAQAICGVERPLSGEAFIDGEPVALRSPREAIARGIYLIPEDRRKFGLITGMTVRENMTLPALSRFASRGWIRRKAENGAAARMSDTLRIKCASINVPAASLSGGNQQKLVLAKWLGLKPRVIVFDEPTRGIDVGARAEIYQLIRKLAAGGVAIVMISSDLEEILGNSDRVAVMHDGRITGVLDRSQCSREAVMRLAVA